MTATPVPELVGMSEQEAFPPNVRTALRVIARDGACATDSAAPSPSGMTDVVLDDGQVVWAGRRSAVPVPPQVPGA